MCLAIPSEIVEINDKMATIEVSGIRREVRLLLLSEEASIGDYVLVHAGFAIQKIDRQAAEESWSELLDVILAEADHESDSGNSPLAPNVPQRPNVDVGAELRKNLLKMSP